MSKRKKYDTSTRLRSSARGATIRFDGNEDNPQDVTTAQGVPIYGTNPLFKYMVDMPHRWRIDIVFEFTGYGVVRRVPVTMATNQALRLNALAQTIGEKQTIAALEQKEGFTFKRKTWKATIV